MVNLPEIRDFKREGDTWYTELEGAEYDLSIPDKGDSPDTEFLPLAHLALKDAQDLFQEAVVYLSQWIDFERIPLKGRPELVSLECAFSDRTQTPGPGKDEPTKASNKPLRGKHVLCYLNWKSDIYGLWIVAFSYSVGRWWPSSFSRRNW